MKREATPHPHSLVYFVILIPGPCIFSLTSLMATETLNHKNCSHSLEIVLVAQAKCYIEMVLAKKIKNKSCKIVISTMIFLFKY